MIRSAVLIAVIGMALGVLAGETAEGRAPWALLVESGAAWQSRNDVRIPGDTGTLIPLTDFGTGPFWASRVYLSYAVSENQEVRALVAPLSLRVSGMLTGSPLFEGRTFEAGAVEALYQFNSYRLTYRWRLVADEHWTWWAGATAKIRDAQVALTQGGVTTASTNLGFVPLAHVALAYQFDAAWSLGVDADAVLSPYGRAEDVWIGGRRALSPEWTLAAGYRFVEGGADVDKVFTFAWIHYGTASLSWRF
jgi:hypothetical protein